MKLHTDLLLMTHETISVQFLPGTGLVVEVFWAGCVSFSCRIELMKAVGERGVSTGVAPPSRTEFSRTTSGLESSSLMLIDDSSLQVKDAVIGS